MKTKFTKGEWKSDIYGFDEHKKVCVYVPNGGFEITDIPDAEANAHLIASAPDMYKEIQAMSSWLRTQIGMGDWHNDLEKLLKKARGE